MDDLIRRFPDLKGADAYYPDLFKVFQKKRESIKANPVQLVN